MMTYANVIINIELILILILMELENKLLHKL